MAQQHSIVIKDDQFQPSNLHIQVGDSIVWDNQDDHDHTATSNNRRVVFDTGVIAAGIVSVIVAILMHYLVEAPGTRWSRTMFGKPLAPAISP